MEKNNFLTLRQISNKKFLRKRLPHFSFDIKIISSVFPTWFLLGLLVGLTIVNAEVLLIFCQQQGKILRPIGGGDFFWGTLFFLFTPLSLYFFAYQITKNWQIGFFSFLSFCFISWFSLIKNPESFHLWFVFQKGNHLMVLPFILPVALLFWQFLKKDKVIWSFFASLGVVFVGIASKTAFLATLIFMTVFSLSQLFLASTLVTLKKITVAALAILGLLLFWYTPSFWLTLFKEVVRIEVFANWLGWLPILLVALPILTTIVFLVFNQEPKRQGWFIILGLFSTFSFVVGSWFFLGKSFFPLPASFIWEFLLASCFLGGALSEGLGFLGRGKILKGIFFIFWTGGFAFFFNKLQGASLIQLENWAEKAYSFSLWTGSDNLIEIIASSLISLLTFFVLFMKRNKRII